MNSVAFYYQRYLGSSIRMKERERPLKLRIEMIKVVLGNIHFPNELHMQSKLILGPQDKIFVFIIRYFLFVFQILYYKVGIIMVPIS